MGGVAQIAAGIADNASANDSGSKGRRIAPESGFGWGSGQQGLHVTRWQRGVLIYGQQPHGPLLASEGQALVQPTSDSGISGVTHDRDSEVDHCPKRMISGAGAGIVSDQHWNAVGAQGVEQGKQG